MQNQQMMRILFEFARNILHQTVFDFPDILARGKSCSIWNPEDVGIHRYHGMSKSGIEDYIRRLSSDSRKSL